MGATVTLDLETYLELLETKKHFEEGLGGISIISRYPYYVGSTWKNHDVLKQFKDEDEFKKWLLETIEFNYGQEIAYKDKMLTVYKEDSIRLEKMEYLNFRERLRYAFTGRLPE